MRLAIALAALVIGAPAFSQTTQTNCLPGYTKGSMNCTSTTSQPPSSTAIKPPAIFDSYARGRELAMREQQLQPAQPYSNPAPTYADIETMKSLVAEKNKREKAEREAYWWQQMNACARVNKEDKALAECRDKLLLSDPYFARANSEIQPPFPVTQKKP